jgi:ribosomal protein S18 acetylase RimI-like enzyme
MSSSQAHATSATAQPNCEIRLANSSAELGWVRALFREYQLSLSVDLGFQGFERELSELPGEYQAPYGALLLALVDGEPAGCCALRPLLNSDHPNACEMKRLYVQPTRRGLRLGRLLVEQTLLLAQQAGFDCLLLDTLSDMEAARALYQDCGFIEVAPYYHNPLPGAHYLKVEL